MNQLIDMPKAYTDVFVDVETFGVNGLAPIVAIAAVSFNRYDNNPIGHTMYYNVIPPANAQYDYDTIIWWLNRDDEARKALSAIKPIALDDMLVELTAFCTLASRIWSRGSDFDLRLLKNWYTELHVPMPAVLSDFRGWRDSRPITDLIPNEYNALKDYYTGHIATHDCMREIAAIQRVYRLAAAFA